MEIEQDRLVVAEGEQAEVWAAAQAVAAGAV